MAADVVILPLLLTVVLRVHLLHVVATLAVDLPVATARVVVTARPAAVEILLLLQEAEVPAKEDLHL